MKNKIKKDSLDRNLYIEFIECFLPHKAFSEVGALMYWSDYRDGNPEGIENTILSSMLTSPYNPYALSDHKTLFKPFEADTKEVVYTLTPEAVFYYLEYVELKEARENSKQAYKLAIWSIGIALLTLLYSIGPAVQNIFNISCL